MKPRSEQELLRGAKAFNVEILAEVYDCYSPGLYRYALRLLGDECMAEDCVSETFSRFLKGMQAGRGPEEHLQAYLYRIAHNWITDGYRRQPPPTFELTENLLENELDHPERQLDRHVEQALVRGALRLLTPDQRQVVILRFLEGWENDRVAEAIQKPVSAVKALQHRALISLRKVLLRDEKEPAHEHKE